MSTWINVSELRQERYVCSDEFSYLISSPVGAACKTNVQKLSLQKELNLFLYRFATNISLLTELKSGCEIVSIKLDREVNANQL